MSLKDLRQKLSVNWQSTYPNGTSKILRNGISITLLKFLTQLEAHFFLHSWPPLQKPIVFIYLLWYQEESFDACKFKEIYKSVTIMKKKFRTKTALKLISSVALGYNNKKIS